LTVLIDERNEGDRGVAHERCKKGKVVKGLFGVRVQDGVFIEGNDASFFVRWLAMTMGNPLGDTAVRRNDGRSEIILQIGEYDSPDEFIPGRAGKRPKVAAGLFEVGRPERRQSRWQYDSTFRAYSLESIRFDAAECGFRMEAEMKISTRPRFFVLVTALFAAAIAAGPLATAKGPTRRRLRI